MLPRRPTSSLTRLSLLARFEISQPSRYCSQSTLMFPPLLRDDGFEFFQAVKETPILRGLVIGDAKLGRVDA